ncbi:putative lipid II flippase FtsW [Alicyclobacillus tolerans]|uniref:FtsW/RodA/SpoVE family cell cycle protein n=1 Tax=Alicyclobacillus tolerans TaxID=90970 RepID=UPI001F2E281F|nr:putative peptidoglycan glycosyltransferase FtsW [Alicyclobacillus tolerans]MCF8565361.1 putative lipid II flippase FtsW [Alicyclobacillus tolerans]
MTEQRHQPDYILFFTVVVLSAVGVITVYSASTVLALHSGLPASYYADRQFLAAMAGILVMSILSRIPHHFWYRKSVLFLLLNMLMLLLVLIPGIGHKALGGRRWFGTGSYHIQPSELAIVTTAVYLSFFFTKKALVISHFKRVQPALVIVALNFALILVEPDMGTAMTLLGTSLVVLFISGAKIKPLVLTMLGMVPVLAILALSSSYRAQRITSFLHPFAHSGGSSYQLLQGLTGVAAGGWFGRGFDMSLEKTGFLPAPQTDFVFPVFVEEWGLIGAITLLVLFGVLIWRGFAIARHAPDRFSALLSIGLTSMITIMALINLGAVTGLMPVTGIPLPFISYGGTSLVVNLGAVGMLLSISRTTLEDEPESDQFADVVPVEEVRKHRESVLARSQAKPWGAGRTGQTGRIEKTVQTFESGYSRSGSSRSSRNQTKEAARESRRSAREVAAARQSPGTRRREQSREQSMETRSGSSWRERNKPTGQPSKGQSAKPKRRLFGKDR